MAGGTTYRYLANIILDKINENGDDSQITINHVIFWINIAANRLRLERKTKMKSDSGAYLILIEGVPVNASGRKKYIELPSLILDMDNDAGVESMTYNEATAPPDIDVMSTKFERTTPAGLQSAIAIPIRKPSPSNPFFYRLDKKLYLVGIENVNVEFLDMFLYSVVDPTVMVSLDTVVPVEEDQIEPLYASVMQLMNFGLPSVQDLKNTGSDKALQTLPGAAYKNMGAQSNSQARADQEFEQ